MDNTAVRLRLSPDHLINLPPRGNGWKQVMLTKRLIIRGDIRFFPKNKLFISMKEKTEYQRPQEEVECESCGKLFKKDGSETRRNNKLGVGHYCSLSCVRTGRVSNIKGNPKNLIPDNSKDKYTGLREHLSRIKKRGKEINIDLDDLYSIWVSQNGICPYTGVQLLHPKDSKNKPILYKASLDRIDSSLGYIKGNIQFVSATANYAKGSMSHNEMIEFCKLVCERWK